jgi:predicted aspartyl protease
MPLNTHKWYWQLLLLILLVLPDPSRAQMKFYNQLDLLEGKKKVTIPFKYIHNFIILDVRLYGILPLKFIFDTGAEHIILFKREYTDILNVEYDKRIPVMGSDLSREIYALITRNAQVEVGGLVAKPYDLLILEEDYFNLDEMIGTPIAGLLGGGFFKNLVVNIDYKKSQMTLYDPTYFKIPDGYLSLPIRIKTNKPYILAEASLQDGTVVQVDLLVDTGAGVPLLLHNNSHPSLHLPEQYIRGKLGMGLGGYLEGYIGRIQKLSFGELTFPGVLTSFQDIEETWLMDKDRYRNGILGNQILNRFNVFFDYINGQMFLKPYHSRQKPFAMDRSGLIIFAYGIDFTQYVVKDVLDNSPALRADIRNGDIILKIQGLPTRYFTLDGINALLQKKEGKRIRLLLKRDNEVIRKEFHLKDLI